MKKILILLTVFCLMLTGIAFANPYLCCDSMTAEVTQIDVTMGGQTYQVARADVVEVAGAWCLVDLATVAPGSYTASALAHYDVWGPSGASADFLFVKPVINEPVNTRLGQVP